MKRSRYLIYLLLVFIPFQNCGPSHLEGSSLNGVAVSNSTSPSSLPTTTTTMVSFPTTTTVFFPTTTTTLPTTTTMSSPTTTVPVTVTTTTMAVTTTTVAVTTTTTVRPTLVLSNLPPTNTSTNSASIGYVLSPAGSTAKVYCRVDSGTVSLCSNPWAVGPLNAGSHKVDYYIDAGAGYNLFSPAATYSWNIFASWVNCAAEGGTCAFSGTHKVRFGTSTAYFTLLQSGGVFCDVSVFGDPAPNAAKSCSYENGAVVSDSTPTVVKSLYAAGAFNLCLKAESSPLASNTSLVQAYCDTGVMSIVETIYGTSFELRVSGTNYCIDSGPSSNKDGGWVVLNTCNGLQGQRFTLKSNASGSRSIKSNSSGQCIDSADAQAAGEHFFMFPCDDTSSQSFERLSGAANP